MIRAGERHPIVVTIACGIFEYMRVCFSHDDIDLHTVILSTTIISYQRILRPTNNASDKIIVIIVVCGRPSIKICF